MGEELRALRVSDLKGIRVLERGHAHEGTSEFRGFCMELERACRNVLGEFPIDKIFKLTYKLYLSQGEYVLGREAGSKIRHHSEPRPDISSKGWSL